MFARKCYVSCAALLAQLALAFWFVTGSSASAQDIVLGNNPRVVQFYSRAPELIYAQAYYMRTMAETLEILEDVKRKRIENRMRWIESIYEARRLRWQHEQEAFEHKHEARDRIVEGRKRDFERRGDELASLPVDIVIAAGGQPLNQMLDRFTNTSLGEFKPTDALPPNTINYLRLYDGVGNNKAMISFASEDDPFSYKPPRLFRSEEYEPQLAEYAEIRERIIDILRKTEKLKQEQTEEREKLEKQLDTEVEAATKLLEDLDNSLAKRFEGRKWTTNTDPQYITFKECDKFITEQIRQLGLLALGKNLPTKFSGKTIQELILYMKDHGYRFAPAAPGGENVYKALVETMRGVFRQVRADEQN